MFGDRLTRAQAMLGETSLDALVVAPSPDLAYLTGYDPMPLERPTLLIVRPDTAAALVVPLLERPLAADAPAADALELVGWTDQADPYAVAADLLPSTGRVAVGDRIWGAHLLGLQEARPGLAWTSARPVVGALRMRKDATEIELLRTAAHAADAALVALLDAGLGGRSELEVATRLRTLLVDHGHDRADFAIVGSGPNGASPHHEPTERTIGRGDVVVLDFGGVVQGYFSDTTRTVAVGESGDEARSVHDTVRRAQAAAIEAVRPGVPIELVDRAARAVIDHAGYGERFIHRTGHGIGLEVHEPPYAAVGDPTILEPGMTFSVEPGIYLDGRFGVRIEDIVVVGDRGAEPLNESDRDLRIVG